MRQSEGYFGLHPGNRWNLKRWMCSGSRVCSRATGHSKQAFHLWGSRCDVIVDSVAEKSAATSQNGSLSGKMMRDGWRCTELMQQFKTRIARNYSNPKGATLVLSLSVAYGFIKRLWGRSREPASCIMEISASKTFSENMPGDHKCQPRLQHNNLVLSAPPHISTFF